MNQKEARACGVATGESIAEGNLYEITDEWSQSGLASGEPYDNVVDAIVAVTCDVEQNHYRQFTPFEFFAKEVNDTGDRAEGIWEAYNEGVRVGAIRVARKHQRYLRKAFRRAYGLARQLYDAVPDYVDEEAGAVLERIGRLMGV